MTIKSKKFSLSMKKAALAAVAATPLFMALSPTAAHAQIINTATVTGTPDSGTLDPVEAVETVTVAVPIVAADDSITGVNGATGQTGALDLFDGDTLDSLDADATNVTLTVPATTTGGQPNAVPTGLTLNADGTVDVDPGTPAGTYSFEYQICETANPNNCATAVATVTVDPSPIVAADDTVTGVNGATGATGVLDLFDGDTVNSVDADATNVVLTVPATTTGGQPNSVPAGLTLNPNGTVDVDPGTPAGTYSFEYQICETLNPSNCTTAVATVTVDSSPIVAADDSTTVPAADATAGVADVLNVFDGDTVNGATATTTNGIVSVAAGSTVPAELTFDPTDGSIDVNPGTLAGDYSFEYQICETLNPANCEEAIATVTVASAPSLQMTKEADDTEFVTVGQVITYTYTVTNNGNVTIRGVSISDTHNADGAAPTPTNPQLETDNGTLGDSTDGNSSDDEWDVLAPGDVIRFTGTYTVQQADIDNLQ